MTFSGLSGVGQIALAAHDAARAAEFYRDKLGLPLVFQASKFAFFDCGGVRLMIEPEKGAAVYFRVDDIGAAVAELKSRGVAFDREAHLVAKMPDHELWMAFFHDPEGNRLALMAEKKLGLPGNDVHAQPDHHGAGRLTLPPAGASRGEEPFSNRTGE